MEKCVCRSVKKLFSLHITFSGTHISRASGAGPSCPTCQRWSSRGGPLSEPWHRPFGNDPAFCPFSDVSLDVLLRDRTRVLLSQYARHLARTALTVLAHMAPEYEPVAVRTALALAHTGSASPAEVPPPRRHTEDEKKRDLTRTSLES